MTFGVKDEWGGKKDPRSERRTKKEGWGEGERAEQKKLKDCDSFGKTHLDYGQTNDREMEMVAADGTPVHVGAERPLAGALFMSREL